MNVEDALQKRRMVRSFDGRALDPSLVEELFADSLRAPTAGNSRGIHWLTLIGPNEVARYFETATDEKWRAQAPRADGLQRASAIGLCVADPSAYVQRYGANDKASSGLGSSPDAWPVPYWIGDAGAATMAALLLAQSKGLDAAFLGAFRNLDELHGSFSIPREHVVYGAVLLGYQDMPERRSASLDRPGPLRIERVHRGQWTSPAN